MNDKKYKIKDHEVPIERCKDIEEVKDYIYEEKVRRQRTKKYYENDRRLMNELMAKVNLVEEICKEKTGLTLKQLSQKLKHRESYYDYEAGD